MNRSDCITAAGAGNTEAGRTGSALDSATAWRSSFYEQQFEQAATWSLSIIASTLA